ncbi:putative peptidase [Thermobifida fusca YX]|uniref:Putative peptidase n=1 Tax=Thermobifida fusca (strain YX) TaxID=269800 RepID=Q47SP1_THEFY|nr:site-2 protease family protein [Thermobifida fusca]AAZ54526.1 putative peptidase [Thermobifida fusca YX]
MSTSDPAPRSAAEEPPTGPSTTAKTESASPGWLDFLPSPMFLLLVGVTALAGWLSWTRAEETVLGWRTAYAPFLLLLGGWLICLTLHQYVRSLLAYRGGDRALRGSGYLKLNPFAFRELGAQVVLPVAFLLLGTFGLNGPAVHVDRSAVTRPFRVLAALGGLATNVVLAAVLAVTVALLVPAGQVTNNWAIGAVMFLCFLNVSAALLALLPVPGTVGYDILTEAVNRWRPSRNAAIFGTVLLFAAVWCPPIHAVFLERLFSLFSLIGVESLYLEWGQTFLRPW